MLGAHGWREYRYTGGAVRWAIDREWIKTNSGQDAPRWRKRGHHRRDLPTMTEAEYDIWKAERHVASRARRTAQRVKVGDEVVA